MPALTTFLQLLKKLIPGDKNDTFNIQTMLNDNWDKIDAFASGLDGRIQGQVADLAALKAIDTTNLVDTAIIAVKALGVYRFDKTSATAGDNDLVVVPTTGGGRWKLIISAAGKAVSSRDTDAHILIKATNAVLGHVMVDNSTITVDGNGKISAAQQDRGVNFDINRFYVENVKPVALFQSDEVYTLINGAQAADVANIKVGSQSLKLYDPDNLAGWNEVSRTGLTLNLAAFQDGSTSPTSDYIRTVFYISDIAKFTKAYFDFETSAGNHYYYEILAAALSVGWNYIDIAKSSFVATGAPNWNNITKVSMGWTSTINAINAYVSYQLIQLVRKDVAGAYPNHFQHKEGGAVVKDFAWNYGNWFIGLEFGELVCRNIAPNGNNNAIQALKGYSDFIMAMKAITKTATSLRGLTWYVDATNYIRTFVFGDVLYLSVTETAAGTVNYTTNLAVAANDTIDFVLRKSGASVQLIAYKNGDRATPYVISATTTLVSNSGYLATNDLANNFANYKALAVTTVEHAEHSSIAEVAKALAAKSEIGSYNENCYTNAAATGALNIDLALASVFNLTLSGAVTLAFVNPAPSGKTSSFTLLLNQGGTSRAVTWPASVKWPGDSVPDVSTINKTAVLTFVTTNGGIRWYGFLAGNGLVT